MSGGGLSPRITTTTPGVKVKGFKRSPLSPAERDITDGVKGNVGISGGTREDDQSICFLETGVGDKELK